MSSDDEVKVDREFIEQLKALDERWRDVDLATKIEAELRESVALQTVLRVVAVRAEEAREKLVYADPSDMQKIISLQAQAQCARIIGDTLQSVRQRGAIAAASLTDDDRAGLLQNEEGNAYDDRS